MKFLCVECDERMRFEDRRIPGDGTLAAVFQCPSCDRAVGLLTNPMETQLVSSLGVKIGGREVPEAPLRMARETVRTADEGTFTDPEPGDDPDGGAAPRRGDEGETEGAGGAAPVGVSWSDEAARRLERVPSFVRGMVRRIYTDWAKERGIEEITPDVMDRARSDLGLEGM